MELLPDELRQQLPSIHKFHNPSDQAHTMIYARFFTINSGVTFYVAEGEQGKADYLFWGLLVTPSLRSLLSLRSP